MFAITYKPEEYMRLYLAKSEDGDFWWDNGSNDDNIIKFSDFDSADAYLNSVENNSNLIKDISKVEIIDNYKIQEFNEKQKSFIPMSKEITFESYVQNMIKSIICENKMVEQEIDECGVGGATTSGFTDAAALQYQSGGGVKKSKKEDSIVDEPFEIDEPLELDTESIDMKEMPRGIMAPHEVAKRQYAAAHPDMKVSTADQFLKKVILNPNAPEHNEYVKILANLLKNSPDITFSNVSSRTLTRDMLNDPNSADEDIVSTYANDILGHRKAMGTAAYSTKGLTNAYGKGIIHTKGFNPFDKEDVLRYIQDNPESKKALKFNGIDTSNTDSSTTTAAAEVPAQSMSQQYDSIVGDEGNYEKADQWLKDYLGSDEFMEQDNIDQLRIINDLKNNADLSINSEEFLNKISKVIDADIDSSLEDEE